MKHWNNINIISILLFPVSLLYLFLSTLDLFFKKQKGKKRSLKNTPKIVVVGNITIGGTGKTPFIQMLANYLISQNKKVGIVSRGYGSHAKVEPFLVTKSSTSFEAGDEALLHANLLDVPVVIAKKRNLAVDYLIENYDLDVILSDDGLQHYQMPRHINIVLLDGLRGLQNKLMFPSGPLRQLPNNLNQADFIFCKGERNHLTLNESWPSFLINCIGFYNQKHEKIDIKSLKEMSVVSAIANPESFYQLLDGYNLNYKKYEFVDHHEFIKKDFEDINNPIVMTQKDFVKCSEFSDLDLYYCKIEAVLDAENLTEILNKINNC